MIIELSTIPDFDVAYDLLLELLAGFQEQTGIEVRTTRMQWSDAWEQLIDMSMRGQGADISYVGSTWISSLVSMNALRPLPTHIVTKAGEGESFIPSTWQSAVMEDDKHPWSIPLSAHTYAIAYRRDLLAQAGLDGTIAFATPFEVEKTVSRLEELHYAEKAWLMPYSPFPASNDLIHTAASWVWSSGGQLIDNHAKQVLFDSPATLAGLKSYFDLLRRQRGFAFLQPHETMEQLIQGKAAVVLTDARSILRYLAENTSETGHIGTASVMGSPWSGGSNLVIWRHTYGYPDRLEAAFKLAEFLTSRETMLETGRRIHTLPARIDAIDELIPPEHALRPVITQLVSSGRTYRTIRLWRLIENHLCQKLDAVAQTILEDKDADLDAVLTENMKTLTQRLNLTLA